MSKESLLRAGFTFTTPSPSISSRASTSQSIHHKGRLSWRSSNTYNGTKLRHLIWEHAEEIFRLIIQQLEGTHVLTTTGDRSLMGIVTKRIVSVVGVSRLEEKAAAGSLEGGDEQGLVGLQMDAGKAKVFREVYDDMHGVSGLHFILFRVECLDRHRWRFYRGIEVCDFELDETSNPHSLQRDDFYQAILWLREAENLHDTGERDYKNVTDEDSTESQVNANDECVNGQPVQENPEYVDVVNTNQTTSFVDIDIRPLLSEFANKQCKLAAYYRKLDGKTSEKNSQAVTLLRSALRKCRFESTIRALYDLSGCYLRGIGVQGDGKMAGFFRYCAGGMRRNYDTRVRWLKRLDMEIGLRRDEEPERRIAMIVLLSRRSLVSPKLLTGELVEKSLDNMELCLIHIRLLIRYADCGFKWIQTALMSFTKELRRSRRGLELVQDSTHLSVEIARSNVALEQLMIFFWEVIEDSRKVCDSKELTPKRHTPVLWGALSGEEPLAPGGPDTKGRLMEQFESTKRFQEKWKLIYARWKRLQQHYNLMQEEKKHLDENILLTPNNSDFLHLGFQARRADANEMGADHRGLGHEVAAKEQETPPRVTEMNLKGLGIDRKGPGTKARRIVSRMQEAVLLSKASERDLAEDLAADPIYLPPSLHPVSKAPIPTLVSSADPRQAYVPTLYGSRLNVSPTTQKPVKEIKSKLQSKLPSKVPLNFGFKSAPAG